MQFDDAEDNCSSEERNEYIEACMVLTAENGCFHECHENINPDFFFDVRPYLRPLKNPFISN